MQKCSVRHEASVHPVCSTGQAWAGRLCKDRSFYFGNFEQRRLNQSGLVTISPANVAAINARLVATGYQGFR